MNDMSVSEVNITPIKPTDGLVGFASVVYGGLYLGSIGIHARLDGSGFRITYPSRKVGNRNLEIYHPITQQVGSAIEQAILAKCREIFERSDDHDRYDKTRHTSAQV